MINNPYKKIVIWGLREKYNTFRYINHTYFVTAKKLGFEVVWVEDDIKNADIVKPGDLVLAAQVSGKMVKEKKVFEDYALPIKEGVSYCLHNYEPVFTDHLNANNLLRLQVYSNDAEISTEKWDTVRFFDREKHVLYQPWGTNLLAEEFKAPIFSKVPIVFWIGSIWNNPQNQGNLETVEELRKTLAKHDIKFQPVKYIPNSLNTFLVRHSRVAPAIGGNFQATVNYLPCRMFKNISFGQLGFSNIPRFKDIFKGCSLEDTSIQALVEHALQLSPKEYLEIVQKQQEIAKRYTYKESYESIFRAFGEIQS